MLLENNEIHSTEMKFACHYLADNINKIYCT